MAETDFFALMEFSCEQNGDDRGKEVDDQKGNRVNGDRHAEDDQQKKEEEDGLRFRPAMQMSNEVKGTIGGMRAISIKF